MAVEYINRKSQKYYLHESTTKTGKPKYYFAMKSEGNLVETIPDGFEIYENPNAQVFLQKIQPKIITEGEAAIVELGIQKFSDLKYCKIDIKKNIITIYTPDQNPDKLLDIYSLSPSRNDIDIEAAVNSMLTYSPMLRFILIDKEKRIFTIERFCFLSSIDDWMEIGRSGDLSKLVKEYVPHLGKESFYELHPYRFG